MNIKIPVILAMTAVCAMSVYAVEPTHKPSQAGAATLCVENDRYTVAVNAAESSFEIRLKSSGKAVLSSGKLTGKKGEAAVKQVTDSRFGDGSAIEVTYPDGNRETVSVHPGLPFVFFRSRFHNGGSGPVVLNHVQTVSVQVELGKPHAAVATLGTGGLLTPKANPGSYAFLAVVDRTSRSGVVGGWISHDRGSGVVFSPVTGATVRIQAQIDYGRLRILPGKDAEGETFALGYFDDARLGLETYADAISRWYSIKLRPQTPGFCTWYMERHSRACDEQHLAELTDYASKTLRPFGFDFIQIDDGWQLGKPFNGPAKTFAGYNPQGPYPSGMKAMADKIKANGFNPGIWFMPFAGTAMDDYFKDHQDWFVKDSTGNPYKTFWGGHCLDMTQEGARGNLADIVRRISHEWGYKVFKMDGFWTGSAVKIMYVNSGYKDDGIGDATFANPDKTNIEALRDGAKLVREAAGPDVFLLGCCVSQNMRSFGGSFGLLDAMRIGPDTSGQIGSSQGSRLWFLNGRVWWNDPDCVYVRKSTPLDAARLNASWAAISGQLFYNSDWIPDLPADRLDILKRCMPPHNLPARPVDIFENDPAKVWLLTDTRGGIRRDVVATYCWNRGTVSLEYPLDRIGLPPAGEYVGFDFWDNRFVGTIKGVLKSGFTGNGCHIFAIRPVSKDPQLLSTSRHVTQGMIDVTGEKWDATKKTLSGVSKVVGGDPYELRAVVPTGAASWKLTAVSVSDSDTQAGVTTKFSQNGPEIRATLNVPTSREVCWQLQFASEKVEISALPEISDLNAQLEFRTVNLGWTDNHANGWLVKRDNGKEFYTTSPHFTDANVPRGKTIEYQVVSLNWNGTPAHTNKVSLSIPLELQAPPTVAPEIFLDTLEPLNGKAGSNARKLNQNVLGSPLKISGKEYAKGLGVRTYSGLSYTVPPGATRFVAEVGLDDAETDPKAEVQFVITGDVKEMGEPSTVLGESPLLSDRSLRRWTFNIELNSRIREIRLIASNGIYLADWVNAGFIVGKSGNK